MICKVLAKNLFHQISDGNNNKGQTKKEDSRGNHYSQDD
jgi:hypothetical protein